MTPRATSVTPGRMGGAVSSMVCRLGRTLAAHFLPPKTAPLAAARLQSKMAGARVDTGVVFPRDLAGPLREQIASGSWKLLAEQEADDGARSIAAKNRPMFELVRPLPSEASIARLLDTAYVASLLEEEGRRVQCGFGYLSPEGATGLRFGAFRFATPLPFRPATLAKLAPAAEAGRTELGVWQANGELVVWGLIHHGDQTFAIDLEHKPTYFSARILRPGTFTVHFDERLQFLFSRDHGHLFTKRFDLLGTLRDGAGIEPDVAAALCRLARRMLAHGHGGTILIVDKEAKHQGLVLHPALTPLERPDRLLADAMRLDERAMSGELKVEGEPPGQYFRRRTHIEQAHDEALDFVAHLTAVDGAVVLDNELGLVGAGATIQTPDSAMPKEVVHEDPRSLGEQRHIPISALGGNRHRSAVCFCAQQEGLALALVASQDGDLSFFARRKDGLVHALRPYELGVGI